MLGVLIKTSLVDYPGRVAATYFLSGCNIRCPYCYNGELVLQTLPTEESQTLDDVMRHLEKRKNVLSGFVLSGGEPLIYENIPEIIKIVKNLGYSIKLDTNGLLPEKLEQLFLSKKTTPDYIAVDIKTNPEKYHLLGYSGNSREKLLHTIKILQALPNEQKEFRTVLCPPLVTKEDITSMSQFLEKDSRWFFAQFRNDNCLDETYNNIEPYTDSKVHELTEYAKICVPNAILR